MSPEYEDCVCGDRHSDHEPWNRSVCLGCGFCPQYRPRTPQPRELTVDDALDRAEAILHNSFELSWLNAYEEAT